MREVFEVSLSHDVIIAQRLNGFYLNPDLILWTVCTVGELYVFNETTKISL